MEKAKTLESELLSISFVWLNNTSQNPLLERTRTTNGSLTVVQYSFKRFTMTISISKGL